MAVPTTIAASSSDGWLLVLAIMAPVVGSVLALLTGGRYAGRIALIVSPVALTVSFAIGASVLRTGQPIVYYVGNWAPPLGLALKADGLSATLIVLTALIMSVTMFFARADFHASAEEPEKRSSLAFWTFFMGLWGALVGVFLGNDLFNLYVALELLTVTAVPLVCLSGRAETLIAALRYLLFALIGSVLYLLGVALIYGAYGTLDISLLASRFEAEPAVWIAAALMTAGLLAKTALFPLHLWLPAAHSGAPAAASALLSALAVKASFYLIAKIWFDVFPGFLNLSSAQLLATLGAGAIIFGGVLALRQVRLKLLIAYSTVAQIGYLFLMFPLIVGADVASWAQLGWVGGWGQLISHACAKAAMFMAAGLIAEALGHDRIIGLASIGRVLPITLLAFALGGLAMIGLPPGGGKSMLATAAVMEGQWWWAAVIVVGGVLAAAYILPVLVTAFSRSDGDIVILAPVALYRELLVLGLALTALGLGYLPVTPYELVSIGRP